jgi:UDP-glucuronate decarboxylase
MAFDDGRVVSNFIIQSLVNKDISIYGRGEQTRSFCYVEDTVSALISLASTSPEFTGPVNIGNPKEITIITLAEEILRLTESKSKLTYHPLPEDDPIQRKPDISLASRVLKWTPKTELENGLQSTISNFLTRLAASN